MDLMTLSKFLFVVIITLPNGSYDTSVTEVIECPPYEIVHQMMNYKLEAKEITSWYADCSTYPFIEIKKQQI